MARHFRRLSTAAVLAICLSVPGAVAQIDPRTALLAKAAWDALAAGQAHTAAEHFRAALVADPRNARLHLGAGVAAYLERRDVDARMELDRVLTHEFTHALVRTLAARGVPTWLNEGLATALEADDLAWADERVHGAPVQVPLRALQSGFADLDGAQHSSRTRRAPSPSADCSSRPAAPPS